MIWVLLLVLLVTWLNFVLLLLVLGGVLHVRDSLGSRRGHPSNQPTTDRFGLPVDEWNDRGGMGWGDE